MTTEIEQRSAEWFAARCGSLGASQIHDALAKVRSGGYGAGRANAMARMVVEILTGQPVETYSNAAMQWGTETEPQARSMLALELGIDIDECGLYPHPRIARTHASPDGLIDSDGLVEIKCPNTATHLDYLLDGKPPPKYVTQMQWQMACTGRKYCWFASFDPRLPPDLQLMAVRIERDDAVIADLETQVEQFMTDLETKLELLRTIRKL